MKCFSFHTKRYFNKKQAPFIMYRCSVIVNCEELNEFKAVVKHLFVVLLSRHENNLLELNKEWFEEKFKQIGSQNLGKSRDSHIEGIDPPNGTFDPPLEDSYNEENVLRSCKRGIFYQWTVVKRNEMAKQINSLNVNNKKENLHFSEDYLNYNLNNMICLAPLWCNMLLGNIGRHGKGEVYTNWSLKYSKKQCVTNITKTQGIIEKHNNSVKHIYLNKKK